MKPQSLWVAAVAILCWQARAEPDVDQMNVGGETSPFETVVKLVGNPTGLECSAFLCIIINLLSALSARGIDRAVALIIAWNSVMPGTAIESLIECHAIQLSATAAHV